MNSDGSCRVLVVLPYNLVGLVAFFFFPICLQFVVLKQLLVVRNGTLVMWRFLIAFESLVNMGVYNEKRTRQRADCSPSTIK